MSRWNEETKTLDDSDGRLIRIDGTSLHAKDLMVRGLEIRMTGIAPADLAAFGHACLAAAGEPVETTPAPFKSDAAFEDVQVGDRVRVTWKGEESIEFTVVEHSNVIAGDRSTYFYKDEKPNYTIDILSRPAPPKPVLPTAAGSVIKVTKKGVDYVGVLTLGADGTWRGDLPLYQKQGGYRPEDVLADRPSGWDAFKVLA